MIKLLKNICFLLIFLLANTLVFAKEPVQLSPDNIKTLKSIASVYNQYTLVKARFIQKDSLGNSAKGWLILQKPGKARIEYENIPVRFIANKNVIMYQDIKLKQKSFVQTTSSPFGYLLEEHFSFFSPYFTILGYSNNGSLIKITITSKKHPEMGQLTLYLASLNAELIGWRILDAKGIVTEFYLNNPIFVKANLTDKSIFNMQRIVEKDFTDIK